MAAAVSAHRYSSSMASSHPSAVDEDDLLASFASDTFSLESNRDRDLLLMASFLQGALPHSSSPPNGPTAAQPGAQWIGGGSGPATSLASANSSAGWNGWRPDASTSYSGSYPSAPPAPSSSFAKDQPAFNNIFGAAAGSTATASGFGAPPPAPPTQTPHGTPMSFGHPSLPPTSPELNTYTARYGTRSSTRAQLQQQQQFAPPPQLNTFPTGCRAPAVSRERAPMRRRSSSVQGLPTAYEAGGQPAEGEEDVGMDCDEDAAMEEEEEESYSGRSGERYAYGNGWAGP